MAWSPAPNRYGSMLYRRCGRSGLMLPAVSLGLWQNFGAARPLEECKAVLRRAFDLGITHFDLANNYGPPYGSAEETFGSVLASDFARLREQIVISTKAGFDMWPGPYGNWGSRKHLLASLDQSLRRLGVDYVDIFYSHRPDPATPPEETLGALETAVRWGKAVYAGISNYGPAATREAADYLGSQGVPLLLHQAQYSMLNRWAEPDLFDALDEKGAGCIAFSPLAQGLLTDRYLEGIPQGSRAAGGGSLSPDILTNDLVGRIRALDDLAKSTGRHLSQLALAWALRDQRVTSVLVGASTVAQLEANAGALERLELGQDELEVIERYAVHPGDNIWGRPNPQ